MSRKMILFALMAIFVITGMAQQREEKRQVNVSVDESNRLVRMDLTPLETGLFNTVFKRQ